MTTAETARMFILETAQGCIDRLSPESPNRAAAERLLAAALQKPILTAMQQKQMESYARTMHRQPPTPRTILGLLEWIA